jgi:hypothetical protein
VATNVAASFTSQEKTIIERCRFYAQFNALMPSLVTQFTMSAGNRQITVNRYSDLSADALTDGVDMAIGKALGLDTVTLTTSEYGLKVIVTKKMVRENVDNVFANAGKLAGDAMAKYREKLLLALFSGVSTYTVGSASTELTLGHIAAAVSTLDSVPASGEYVGVFHPFSLKDLWDDLTAHGANVHVPWYGLAEDMARKYIRGRDRISGIPIMVDGNLVPDGADDVVSGVFCREAFGLVTEKTWDVEKEVDASMRATELVFVADEGVAELVDKYCVQMTFDAARETA